MLYPYIIPLTLIAFTYALFTTPIRALCTYALVLFGFSYSWTLSVSTYDFTVARIVILAVLLNVAFRSSLLYQFRWNKLDTLVLVYYGLKFYALTFNVPFEQVLEREGGYLLDAVVPYFMARLIVREMEDLLTFFKTLVYFAIPLAFIALYHSLTGINLAGDPSTSMRMGMYRAKGVFGDYISCGLFFAGVIALCLAIRPYQIFSDWKTGLYCALIFIGVFATISSAPLFALIISVSFIFLYRQRQYLPLVIFCSLIWLLFLEVYSNRHFYEVFTRLSFNSATSYYRVGLIDEALGGGMTGHWWTGYGYVGIGPGSDNTNFEWRHLDLVNLYIAILARVGLLGLLPYLLLNFFWYRRLYQAHRYATAQDQWLIWSIAGLLVGWNIAMMTVSAMAQIETLLMILVAISHNLVFIAYARSEAMETEEIEVSVETDVPQTYSHSGGLIT